MFPIRNLIYSLPVAALVGLGAGMLISKQFLTKYVATIQMDPIIPGSLRLDTALFRNVRPIVSSSHTLLSFVTLAGEKFDKSGLDRLEERLKSGESNAVKIEYNYGISKSDLRDMPEAVAKEYGTQIVKEGIGTGPLISTTDKNEDVAVSMAKILSISFLDSSLRMQLEDLTRGWSTNSNVELVGNRVALLSANAGLESLQRRLDAMKMLRDVARASNAGVDTRVEGGTMVQVTGPRFLSISQQYLAIESEKIDAEEALRQVIMHKERLEIRKRLGDASRAVAIKPSTSAIDLLNLILATFRTESEKLKQQLGPSNSMLQRVVGDFDVSFSALETRYIDQPIERVSVRREGPTTLGAALVGALAGMALFMILFVLWHRLNSLRVNS